MRPFYKNLKKPVRGWSYNINALMKHAHPDALGRVQRTESKFTCIRRINHHLTKSRFHLREAMKAEAVFYEGKATEGMSDSSAPAVAANPTLTSLLESTISVSNDLFYWADNAVRDFISALKARENRLAFKDYSKLTCRAVRKNDTLPVYIDWLSIRWHRNDDGTAKAIFSHIKKPGRGFRCTITTLMRHAHPNSDDLVEDAESRFASLRKINYHLSRIRFHLREAIKAESILDDTTQEISTDEQK